MLCLCITYYVFIMYPVYILLSQIIVLFLLHLIFHESHIYTIIVYNYLMFECLSEGSEGKGER